MKAHRSFGGRPLHAKDLLLWRKEMLAERATHVVEMTRLLGTGKERDALRVFGKHARTGLLLPLATCSMRPERRRGAAGDLDWLPSQSGSRVHVISDILTAWACSLWRLRRVAVPVHLALWSYGPKHTPAALVSPR